MIDKEELPPILSDLENLNDSIALVPLSAAGEWQTIIDRVVDDLDGDIPDKVIRAAEYLICGWPTHKIAERLNTKKETIRGWLTRYPKMAVAVNYGQRELYRWRMAQLEQEFLTALDVSQRILDLGSGMKTTKDLEELESLDPKILAIQAQQSRFIISLFAGQKMDLRIKSPSDDRPALKAQKDALDYLAEQITDKLGTVEARPETTYRVIDINSGVRGPLLDDKGDPFHGKLGEIDQKEEGTLCHVCGERVAKLYMHVTKGHKMKVREYEIVFMLDKDSLRQYGK
jgi:hypothetical protein